ncbi:MAG: LD-carboxypeptidase [Acidobacteriales bacterium]|nr:LD-carboxypeptidase [Terriglobales bacterium]
MVSKPPKSPHIKPPALNPGETIGIVAPASYFKRELFDAGCAAIREMGYQPFYFDSIFDRDLYFAGSVQRRARELEEMFARDEVKAIVCVRGGYGSNYLLEALNVEKILAHPKIFVGYSDVTSLLTYLADEGMVTFHGPMLTKDLANADGWEVTSWQNALTGANEWELNLGRDSGIKLLAEGSAEGIFYGGCLSMLVASLGTPYEIDTAGCLLFLEDIGAKPYQVDRMLMQLKLAGKFEDVHGIIFGEMVDCFQDKNQGFMLEEVVSRIVEELNVPVAYGLRSGHVTRGNITLPIGIRTSLTVGDGRVNLKFLEAATTAAPILSVAKMDQ